jgi:hypothetical protein
MRQKLLADAALEGDDCPVDEVCDSIPSIVRYIVELEGKVRDYKTHNAKLSADLGDAERRINNLKSQKQRRLKKKGR